MKAVILAGGIGTRLWPLSRQSHPKQFTSLVTEEPLLKDTYRRLLRLFTSEDIYFSTSPLFADAIKKMFPEVPMDRIIVEPAKKDTGPAMGYVAAYLSLISPDEPITFVPSDHYVRDEEKYLNCIRVAGMLVEQTGKLLNIGIKAEFPSTALGYLKVTERQDEIDGIELYGFGGQIEKPTYEVAKELLESGDYLWNGNYLTWTPVKFLEAFDAYAPEMGVSLRNIQKLLAEGNREEAVSVFEAMEPISLDYAIGEKFNHDEVAILKGDFGWSDVGAWDTLYARLAEDRNESNIVRGESIVIDSSGNLVHTDSKKLVALVGVENIVVIDTEDALLVTTHSYAQRVKEVIEELKSRKSEHLL